MPAIAAAPTTPDTTARRRRTARRPARSPGPPPRPVVRARRRTTRRSRSSGRTPCQLPSGARVAWSFRPGHGARCVALPRCRRSYAQLRGGLLDGQAQPVPQHDHLALHGGQRLERVEQGRAAPRRRGPGAPRRQPVESRPLAAPRPPGLVDVGPDEDLADVRLLAPVAVQPRPRDVQLDQGGLQQVVGLVPVPAEGVRDASQMRLASRDERDVRRRSRSLRIRGPLPSRYSLSGWKTGAR